VQIFNGEKPANTAPIRVDNVPGTQDRYSGGGVTIEQQLIMDISGTPFPEFMRANVDSLGEAYMNGGQKVLAIASYEKALQLDPTNRNAVEMLKKLKESK
jgi:tetratricopeptide (TPR) repeat protein